ncbi:pantoate--beta-alanine ligase [Acuticoccus sp. I52.16.1]|uniref:pantoate--beta-alanine ligase n=1 Tax=Acuticoccus sp. I52.16.1 TaxID=2928472 RepID=UPI001FCFBFF4|nr:pantoate--beta-alanine ligase [Acuticoccus sp. I52.16.1]UOM35361.1 pantoate--beta-alanine ligase [Acuticoccus sp. I52.16.1]
MQVHYSKADFRAATDGTRAGRTLGLVPTMGALHDGHLSLVHRAEAQCDAVAVSIFVNPLQFGPGEDFGVYPRTLEADLALLEAAAVDHVLVPTPQDIYPDGFQTTVINRDLSWVLCGASRVGHFDGVLTVVLKLINIARCDRVYFGKKDYQQFKLVARMVSDLDVPTEVVGCPTVREASGLALSSRNAYLAPAERAHAVKLSAVLTAIRDAHAAGERDVARLTALAERLSADPEIALEYLELRSPDLATRYEDTAAATAVALIAARVGDTRLIDNVELGFEV